MTTLEILKIVASMLGGLALFLAGMSMMSDSLASMTGGSLDHLIDRVTKNKFLAFLFGAVLTALVQSASATTVLTVGLVNSGMIEFTKAIGLIIGANLGTTATAWVLSLNAIGGESLIMTIIKPSFFLPFLGIIGVGMTMFSRSAKKKTIGSALLGFEDGRQRSGSTLFTDICYAEEQLVDYCDMIAEALIRYDRENGESRQGNSVSDQQLRRQVHEMFRDKFEELERA